MGRRLLGILFLLSLISFFIFILFFMNFIIFFKEKGPDIPFNFGI